MGTDSPRSFQGVSEKERDDSTSGVFDAEMQMRPNHSSANLLTVYGNSMLTQVPSYCLLSIRTSDSFGYSSLSRAATLLRPMLFLLFLSYSRSLRRSVSSSSGAMPVPSSSTVKRMAEEISSSGSFFSARIARTIICSVLPCAKSAPCWAEFSISG